jgi:hypothetical protein
MNLERRGNNTGKTDQAKICVVEVSIRNSSFSMGVVQTDLHCTNREIEMLGSTERSK